MIVDIIYTLTLIASIWVGLGFLSFCIAVLIAVYEDSNRITNIPMFKFLWVSLLLGGMGLKIVIEEIIKKRNNK